MPGESPPDPGSIQDTSRIELARRRTIGGPSAVPSAASSGGGSDVRILGSRV